MEQHHQNMQSLSFLDKLSQLKLIKQSNFSINVMIYETLWSIINLMLASHTSKQRHQLEILFCELGR